MTLRVAVTGVGGRMGRAVAQAVLSDANATLVSVCARQSSDLVGKSVASALGIDLPDLRIGDTLDLSHADVVIDFTLPESSLAYARQCAGAGVPIVMGTTGFTDEQRVTLEASVGSVASCRAANFSTGVNLAYRLLELSAKVLGEAADIEIHEAHHKHKIDAPSGTALAMGDAIAQAKGADLSQLARYGRSSNREAGTIGFSVTRAGDIVGEHTVLFASEGERLEITHKASSRSAFATGALKAAHFIADKPAGSYTMADVLGLS